MLDFQKKQPLIDQARDALLWLSKNRSGLLLLALIVRIFLFYIIVRLLYPILIKSTKNNEKIVVSCTDVYYNGNSRAVFEYMQKYSCKYDCYWIAKNLHTFRILKKKGKKVFYVFSLLGIPYFLKTDVWIRTHTGFGGLALMPHKNYKVIQLWHGIGPKAISFSKKDYDIYDAWCVASKFSKQRHIELWNAPPEKLYVTGFARMDALYNYLKMPKGKLLDEIGINKKEKIILHAPTFDVGLWPWGKEYEEFERLCRFLKEKKLILILRLHPYAKIKKRKLKRIISKYKNVYWFDMSKEPDTMKLLAITDILITDWSSIYTEYFLTKKPIIFLEVNKKYFTEMRGKPEIPPEYRAGEIICNKDEFYEALKLVLKKGNRYEHDQDTLLRIIHGNVDGKASKRVIDVINNLIKTEKLNTK